MRWLSYVLVIVIPASYVIEVAEGFLVKLRTMKLFLNIILHSVSMHKTVSDLYIIILCTF